MNKAKIKNLGHGLPSVGDTVLLDGAGLCDAIAISSIVSVAAPKMGRGGMYQPGMIVEGRVLRGVAAEQCVSEYVATAKLIAE